MKIRLILVFLLAGTVSGCGWFERYVVANTTGYSRVCIKEVSYLQFASGVTVEYTVDGKIKTC